MDDHALSERAIGCAIEVHRHLGPGLLESAYEDCLAYELEQAGLAIRRQAELPITYKGIRLAVAYRLDIVVENRLVLEIKSAERVLPIYEAQLLTYLRMSGLRVGLVLNFNHVVLKEGIRRVVA
jgi:GxxExxY protein